ncbi:MAG TPA: site-specific integrase [Blastocatellia bacterium]|nr:site-specific integrase [Blastocatellia bacterium]
MRDDTDKTGWRQIRETLPDCTSKKEALLEMSKRVSTANLKNDSQPQSNEPTLAEFAVGLWKSYLENRRVKASTIYSYQSMLDNHILPVFGRKRLREITTLDLTRFFDQKRREKASKYALNLYALLNVMFEVAVQYDLIEKSPVRRKLHRPMMTVNTKKVALLPHELQSLLQQIPSGYRVLLLTLMVTGLRSGELLGLWWSDFDQSNQRLAINRRIWRGQLDTPKTEASMRNIHLPAALVELLLEHKNNSEFAGQNDFIFCRQDGSPLDPDYVRNFVLYPAMDAAGIERQSRTHGFHLFRHTAGSIVHNKTRDLKLAQELLGHARLSTTSDIYIHAPDKTAELATETIIRDVMPTKFVTQSVTQNKELVN